jgi:ParB/RepB/Spo0J family partition protein
MQSDTRLIPAALIVEPPEPMRMGFDAGALDELAQSIRSIGLLQPLIVYPELARVDSGKENGEGNAVLKPAHTGRYIIAAGHRRYLACRMIGLIEILCTIREGDADDYEGDMIAENMFREALTPFEEGNRFKEISIRPNMTEERLQKLCGHKKLHYIYERINLVDGDADISLAVHEGKINLGVAKELNKVSLDFYRKKMGELTPEQEGQLELRARQHRKYLLALACDTGTTRNQAHSWVVQWEIQEGIAPPPDPAPHQPAPQIPIVGFVPCCCFCGQNHRPYDLENVYICREELRALKVAYAQTENAS